VINLTRGQAMLPSEIILHQGAHYLLWWLCGAYVGQDIGAMGLLCVTDPTYKLTTHITDPTYTLTTHNRSNLQINNTYYRSHLHINNTKQIQPTNEQHMYRS
jgi:hypothetical protein